VRWFKCKLDKFPATVQQKILYQCVHIFMRIRAANELQVALIMAV